jgi:hypothetical protein
MNLRKISILLPRLSYYFLKNVDLIVLLGFSLVVLHWFKFNEFKAFWDVNPIYEPFRTLYQNSFIWNPFINAGSYNNFSPTSLPYDFFYAIGSIFFGATITQEVSWWLILFFQELFTYLMLSYLISKRSRGGFVPVSGSLIYAFNPYSAFIAWGDSAPFMPIAMCVLPLIIYLLCRFVSSNGRQAIFLFLAALLSPFIFESLNVIIPIIFILLFFLIGYIIGSKKKLSIGRIATRLSAGFFLVVLINLFWILPDFITYITGNSSVNNTSGAYYTFLNVQTLSIHTPISITARLLGEDIFYNNWWSYSWLYYESLSPIAISLFVAPITSIFAYVISKREDRILLSTCGFIAITGIIMSSGSNIFQVGVLYKFLVYNVPLFQSTDYPELSWSLLTVFGYSILITYFIFRTQEYFELRKKINTSKTSENKFHKIILRAKKHFVYVIVIIIIISAIPMWSGQLLTNEYNTNFVLPHNISKTSTFLNDNSNCSKTLVLPADISALTSFKWNGGFLAYNPLDLMTNVDLIANYYVPQNLINVLYRIPGDGLGVSLFNESNSSLLDYSILLKMNAVRFILVISNEAFVANKTINYNSTQLISFLLKVPSVKFYNSIGNESIFLVANSSKIIYDANELLSNWYTSQNILPIYASSLVSFSSPFPEAKGSVKYTDCGLNLTGYLNKTDPWETITNILPMNIKVISSADLLVVYSGNGSGYVPIVQSGNNTHFLGQLCKLDFGDVNASLIVLPSIRQITHFIFSSVNGTIKLKGIYLFYNLLTESNLANLTILFPNLENDHEYFPVIAQEAISNYVKSIVNETYFNLSKLDIGTPLANISDLYVRSNLTWQSGSSSPAILTIKNGSEITIKTNNSDPWTDIVNLCPLSVHILVNQYMVIRASTKLGFAVASTNNYSGYTLIGTRYFFIGNIFYNILQLPENFTLLNHLWIFIQPFKSVNIYSINIITSNNSNAYTLFKLNGPINQAVINYQTMVNPSTFKFNAYFSVPGTYWFVLLQSFSKDWVIHVSFSGRNMWHFNASIISGDGGFVILNVNTTNSGNISIVVIQAFQIYYSLAIYISTSCVIVATAIISIKYLRKHNFYHKFRQLLKGGK